MEKKELIKRIKERTSAVELYKMKDDIVKALGKTSLSKKLQDMKSVVDFYSHKEDILYELSGKENKKREGD